MSATTIEAARRDSADGGGAHGEGTFGGYADRDLPLGGYAALMTAFAAAAGGFGAWIRRSGRKLPESVPLGDVALLGVATYKLSRLLAKDVVTSPLRAPFARFEEYSGPNEVKESARGGGLRRAVGELISSIPNPRRGG